MDRMMMSFLLLGSVCFLLLPLVAKCRLVPALYVFGDSQFDNGNNNLLLTLAKVDYLPYGVNFAKGPTGRFTNGRNVVDFFAEYLQLPYPPPFLSLKKCNITTGLNFASGASGILPETGSKDGKCLNLDDQVSLFKTTAHKDSEEHLSKSIFVFSIGSNDYIGNYLNTKQFNTSKIYDPQQFSELLVKTLSRHLQGFFDLGARKFVVLEIGPIGCIPYITSKTKHFGLCVEETNTLVSYFNVKLQEMLNNMTSTLPGSMFVLGRTHWFAYDAIMNPAKYGLLDSSNPCCKTLFNGTSICIPLLSPCSDVDKHFFWDGYHQTEVVYSLVASRCINDTSFCSPMNIKDLVAM